MAMTRAQFRKQLQLGLNSVFAKEYKHYPEEYRMIFETETSDKAFEEDVLDSGFGAASIKQEGAGVAYDSAEEVWTARYTHVTVALAFSITEEAEEDGLYGDLGKRYSKSLARSMQHTTDINGAAVLNNGHSNSYKGGDGKALFATDHPLSGGGTFSNKLSTAADLSETSLEDACIQIEGFVDERGIPADIRPKRLVIPRQSKFLAHRILMSTLRSGTDFNDTNALRDMGMFPGGTHINHRLTDSNAWYVVTDCMDGLKHFVRKKIMRKIEGDFNSGNMRYRARERYSFGWSNPRGAFSSQGA